jgi:glucan phosphoethanolaminetransferase (alkaline phosphatase superfamily)
MQEETFAPLLYVLPYSEASNPRDRSSTWHGRAIDAAAAARQMTVVLVIGESVRADYLRECGGPDRTRALDRGTVVACDVSAGSNATHTSVPLLVSRDLPGQNVRVSTDATFLDALHGAGFESYWLAVQEHFIAWPDARRARYRSPGIDRKVLLPVLDEALAEPAPRRAVVVHAYNAHVPYCARYDQRHAPYPVRCPDQSRLPTRDDGDAELLRSWRHTYANAVDESVGFLDAVIDRLRELPGEVFLIYTPDHGENLFDDARGLYGHALRIPSRWDIAVPAVFWANDAWRERHSQAWARLARNASAPLMHADLVPTLLAAAGVAYDEPRTSVVNLLAADVPTRRRIVQRAFGTVVDMQELMHEAAGLPGG